MFETSCSYNGSLSFQIVVRFEKQGGEGGRLDFITRLMRQIATWDKVCNEVCPMGERRRITKCIVMLMRDFEHYPDFLISERRFRMEVSEAVKNSKRSSVCTANLW